MSEELSDDDELGDELDEEFSGEPRRFGRFILKERIAVGGMAELYRAVLPGPAGFEKTVALKRLRPRLSSWPKFREMFLHEGRIMATLVHRNLLQVYELGEIDGELYMCLEFVYGCDLSALIEARRGKGLPPGTAAWIAREVCRGLTHMHVATDSEGKPLNIVHRDVTPHNVLVTLDGDIKLADFGVAKSQASSLHTTIGSIRGKLQYLSPEQARGAEVSPRTDVYAVGLVLFEMLCGDRYLTAPDAERLLKVAANPTWRPIREVGPNVPEPLESIVERALRPSQPLRFPTAESMGDALSAFLGSLEGAMPDSTDVAPLVHAAIQGRGDTLVLRREEILEKAEPLAAQCEDHVEANTATVLQTVTTRRTQALTGSPDEPQETVSLTDLPEKPAQHPVGLRTRFLKGHRKGLWRQYRMLIPAAAIAAAIAAVAVALALSLSQRHDQPQPRSATRKETSYRPVTDAPSPRPRPIHPAPQLSAQSTPRRPIEVRAMGRGGSKRKRGGRPKKRATTTQPATHGTRAARLNDKLAQQRQSLKELGLRGGDWPQIDVLFARASTQLRAGSDEDAKETLDSIHDLAVGFAVDRAFVERKIVRLQRELARLEVGDKYVGPIRNALSSAVNGRYAEANAFLNTILDSLAARPRRGQQEPAQ